MVTSATQKWIDKLKNKPTTPSKNVINTNPIPTTGQTFTPKQQQMIADKFWTQQNFMDKVVEVWQTQWVDWNKLLNQTNAALKWTSIPNILWAESVNANKMLENDRTGFVAPDDALTNMINTTFPNLWTQLNKWYETTFGVWQEIEWMLKDELARYQSAYWPNWTMRKMLDEEIASQQQRLAWEKELMNVQYWLTNAGIDTNAIESWASSWQVAASKAAANKQSLLQQAEYNDRLAKFGTDKLKSYQDMEDKLSTYIQDYITKFWNTKDKYVIDNFNNLVNLQSSLAIQIKNLEAQNKALAADAANTAAIANAMWGKATSTWNMPAVDWVTWPTYNWNTWSNYIPTPLREAVEPRNPDLFKNLPVQTQQQLIQTYWSEQWALQALSNVKTTTWWTDQFWQPQAKSLAEQVVGSVGWSITAPVTWVQAWANQNVVNAIKESEKQITALQTKLQQTKNQLSATDNRSPQYRALQWQIAETQRLLDVYNNQWNAYKQKAQSLWIQ